MMKNRTMARAPPGKISWPHPQRKGAGPPAAAEEEEEEEGLVRRTSLDVLSGSRGGKDMRKRDGD